MVIITEKACKKCGVTKPSYEFGRDKRNKDGLKTYCRDCENQSRRKTPPLRNFWVIPAEIQGYILRQATRHGRRHLQEYINAAEDRLWRTGPLPTKAAKRQALRAIQARYKKRERQEREDGPDAFDFAIPFNENLDPKSNQTPWTRLPDHDRDRTEKTVLNERNEQVTRYTPPKTPRGHANPSVMPLSACKTDADFEKRLQQMEYRSWIQVLQEQRN